MMRTHLLISLLITLLLSACGGGGTTIAEGGIGGTGISMGPITGFGSVWVNGVRYQVDQADFFRDGQRVSGQSEYRVGEVVTVQGTVNPNGNTGIASQVTFNRNLQGVVTAAVGTTLTVLNQTVHTNGLTVLHGFTLLADLSVGNVVEVSGQRNAAGELYATSIRLQQTVFTPNLSVQALEGRITAVEPSSQHFTLAGLSVDYAQAELYGLPDGLPAQGMYVKISSNHPLQGKNLLAARVTGSMEYPRYAAGTELELEGLITRFTDTRHFSVNGQPVVTMASTQFEDGRARDLQLNATVEVDGSINMEGVLVAEEVSIRQANNADIRELEGSITALDPATQTLTLLGNRIAVNQNTILLEEINDQETSLRFADLRVNDRIEVKARQRSDGTNSSLLALRIDREAPDSTELEVKGIATQIDRVNGTLQVLGVQITTDQQTEFNGATGSTARAHFFAALVAGASIIKAEGLPLGNEQMLAISIKLDDDD